MTDSSEPPEKHSIERRRFLGSAAAGTIVAALGGLRPGYWENRGHDDHGDPWAEERYS